MWNSDHSKKEENKDYDSMGKKGGKNKFRGGTSAAITSSSLTVLLFKIPLNYSDRRTDRRMDRQTDGPTKLLVEMRSRI